MQVQSLIFLQGHRSLQKNNAHQKTFVENLGLLVIKKHLQTQFVESIWLKHLVIQLCLHIVLPTKEKPSIRKCY
jgi:hypothetical protein